MKKILRLGNTTIEYFNKLNNKIFIKMENENPTGSIKDRSVWYMIKDKLNYNLKYKDSIHFVSRIQNYVSDEYLGRVFQQYLQWQYCLCR